LSAHFEKAEELNGVLKLDLATPTVLPNPRYAIGSFLGAHWHMQVDDTDDDDWYYVGARTLAYQLLHAPDTKLTEPNPFVVLISKDVRQSKRERLKQDGAIVLEVEHVPCNISIEEPRWLETLTKLRLFDPKIMPYERVLMMDTDTAITRPIGRIFHDASSSVTKINKEKAWDLLPDDYAFSATPEPRDRNHPYPFLDPEHKHSYFNSGLVLFKPCTEIFQHYLEIIAQPELFYNDLPDQDLLNYVHRWTGPLPWRRLHYSWFLASTNQNDLDGGMAIVHGKYWHSERGASQKYAYSRRWEMQRYWDSQKEG
jgi:alpha-N-acetylglucosamine transferase